MHNKNYILSYSIQCETETDSDIFIPWIVLDPTLQHCQL